MGDDTYIHSLCPQYGESEVKAMLAPLQAENARLRELLAQCASVLPRIVEFGDVRGDPLGQSVVRLHKKIIAAIDAAGSKT